MLRGVIEILALPENNIIIGFEVLPGMNALAKLIALMAVVKSVYIFIWKYIKNYGAAGTLTATRSF